MSKKLTDQINNVLSESKDHKAVVKKYNSARKALEDAEAEMKAFFKPEVERLAELGKYKEAKEYLRPMPIESAEKVLFFRYLIIHEKQRKGK